MSVQGSGDPTEQEANVDLKGVIKDLAEQIKKLTDIVEKSTKKINANTTANADWHKYQALMRIEQEKEHGRQVRLNKEYGRSAASLQMFTGLLTKGASAGFIFNKLANTIGGVSKELDKFKQETVELAKLQKKYAGLDLAKPENIAERDIMAAQQARTDTAKEEMNEKKGGSGKLAEGISSMKAFAEKHKTGILIGAGSIGILLTVLKKAFDVSPMFQAIKKLLHFGFMLILRPIGDFFGFIMRPIMVMMLRKFIIPWYKDVYPAMKKWGTYIGEKLVPVMEAILEFLTAGGGAGLAVAGGAVVAGTVAANVLMYRKMMAIIGGGKTTVTKATTTLTSRITTGFKSMGTKIVQILKHPQVVIKQITSNIGRKLSNMTTSIRTAITSVRTTLTTTASRITSLFTKGQSTLSKNIGIKLNQIIPKITTTLKNVATTIGSKVGQILPKIQRGFVGLAGAFAGLSGGAGNALSKITQTVTNLFGKGKITSLAGKGGIISLIAMLTEGTVASPETLGGWIDQDDPNRLDKKYPWLFDNKLSEDEEGNFQTVSPYGRFLADVTNNPLAQEGGINLAYMGGMGQGGLQESRNERGTVIINVDHISNEMDLKHVGDLFSEKLQEDNKKTAGT